MTQRLLLRRTACCAGLALALAGFAGGAQAGDIYVIAAQPLALSAQDVKDVFLGEMQFAGGVKLAPVDNGALQAEFLERVMRMAPNKYAGWWTKKAFRDGVNAPPLKSTDVQVLIHVRSTPGAIGYVSEPPAGVHVVGRY